MNRVASGRSAFALLAATILASMSFGPVAAQDVPLEGSAAAARATVGTLLVAHGSDEVWNERIHTIADLADTGGPIEVSFLMGDYASEYRFQDRIARLVEEGAERVIVVPVLASSHSAHYDQIRWLVGESVALSDVMVHHLEMAGIERPEGSVPMVITQAIDASIEIADVLSDRALALAENPAERALFLVGHGPNGTEDYARWMENLRVVADRVEEATGFRDVKIGLLRDDAPDPVRAEAVKRIREIIELQHELTGQPVVVVPILVSKGYISTTKLPNDLSGLSIAYDGEGLLPHPAMARWVERRVREAVGEAAWSP